MKIEIKWVDRKGRISVTTNIVDDDMTVAQAKKFVAVMRKLTRMKPVSWRIK